MRFAHVRLTGLAHLPPPAEITSAEIEARLRPLYQRLRLPEGRLELMTGIRARRFWETPVRPSAVAAEAGAEALRRAGTAPGEIDLLVHAGVCRDRLEPATAAYVHERLGISPAAQIFDVSNACLGFLNALVLAGGMIDAGLIRRALVVSGEDGRPLLERTLATLLGAPLDRQQIKPYFANLTIGAGAAAAVLAHDSLAPTGAPRLHAAAVATDSSANHLCQGNTATGGDGLEMLTEGEQLLEAGLILARATWDRFQAETGWSAQTPDRVICHQVGRQHQVRLLAALGIDPARDFITYDRFGNVGSVSLPLTLSVARQAGAVQPGQKIALLGIGSGLSCLMMALET